MGASQEVSEVDKFAVVLVLHIDDAPSVLSAADLLAIDNDRLLATDNSKGDDVLDCGVGGTLLVIELIVVVGIHADAMESELLLYSLLEGAALLEGEGVSLSDDGDDVDDIGELLEDDNIDRLQRMARWLDEEQAAVDASVLNIAFALGGELFSEIGRVLILDVLHNRIPARAL